MPIALLASLRAPIAIVAPSRLTEMELPNSSKASVLEPFRKSCCVHVEPVRVKTYTAPASCEASSTPSSSCAPAASVLPSPLNARRDPNQSDFPVFEALRYACCDHTLPLRTKTYTAPAEVSD